LQNPAPLCDFRQWIDTERPKQAFDYLRREKEMREMEEEFRVRRMKQKEKEEEMTRRREEKLRKEAEKREAEREIKRERARRNKAALDEGGEDALKKGKWPRCTQ
jgi:hypothetical protein